METGVDGIGRLLLRRIAEHQRDHDGNPPTRIVLGRIDYAMLLNEVHNTGMPQWGKARPRMFGGAEIVTTDEC